MNISRLRIIAKLYRFRNRLRSRYRRGKNSRCGRKYRADELNYENGIYKSTGAIPKRTRRSP